MILLLEGFDGSGKSTLTKMLTESFNDCVSVWHPGKPPESDIEVIERCHEQNGLFKVADKIDLIMDRTTCITDNAYKMMQPGLDYDKFCEAINSSMHVLVIYCHTTDLSNQNFLLSEHDNEGTVKHAKDNASEIMGCYDKIMKQFEGGLYFKYDYKQPEAYTHLLKYINQSFNINI